MYIDDKKLIYAYRLPEREVYCEIPKNIKNYIQLFLAASAPIPNLSLEDVEKKVLNAIGLNNNPLSDEERLRLAIDICLKVANLHEGLS